MNSVLFKSIARMMAFLLFCLVGTIFLVKADWQKQTYDDRAQEYKISMETEHLSWLKFQKDHAIDKLNIASKNEDFKEVTRLSTKLEDLSLQIDNLKNKKSYLDIKEVFILVEPIPQEKTEHLWENPNGTYKPNEGITTLP